MKDSVPPIYLDNHATTQVDARVLEKMLPYFSEHYGNAGSRQHKFGWTAQEAVDDARAQVAALINADAADIVFTSGATEANNLALKGVFAANVKKGKHIVTQASEHKAVLDVCEELRKQGAEITVLPVDEKGLVSPVALRQSLRPDTILVSIMFANNEVGTLQPLREISAICRAAGVLLHSDAAQGLSCEPFDVKELGVDLASLSAHKMYGPKGVGALFLSRQNPKVELKAQLVGGGQEKGRRSGTLNVPGIVGFGFAASVAKNERAAEAQRLTALRQILRQELERAIPAMRVNGHPELRLAGNLHLSFLGVEAEALIMSVRELAISSGAACASTDLAPSHVLLAMGLSPEDAHSSIRIGIGRFTTEEEIKHAAHLIVDKVQKLRHLNPITVKG